MGPRLFLSNGSLLGLGMHEGRTNPRLSWGLWALIAAMALFFVSMKEAVWAFLALWSTLAMAAPSLAHRSKDRIAPAGAAFLAALPMLFYSSLLLLGIDPRSDGTWENLLAAVAYYSVSLLTILSLCIGTSIRLNWALLNWALVSLALMLCGVAVIIQFISDQYLGTTYLNGDNQVAMVQLTWAFVVCGGIGLVVSRHGRGKLSIYQPYWKKPWEGNA
jgi:hypothetical protein